jgi:hypothetical protein
MISFWVGLGSSPLSKFQHKPGSTWSYFPVLSVKKIGLLAVRRCGVLQRVLFPEIPIKETLSPALNLSAQAVF